MSAAFLPADIICCYGRDFVSQAITYATAFPVRGLGPYFGPSHVGIVVADGSKTFLLESTSLLHDRPCLLTETERSGPQAQEICCRIDDYTRAGGRVEVLRLYRPLDTMRQVWLRNEAFKIVFSSEDQSYDLPGAVLSATRFLRWLLPQQDDAVWFCSELVRRLLTHIGVVISGNSCATPHALLRELTWGTTAPYRRHALYYPGEGCK